MKNLIKLYNKLDSTTKTLKKKASLIEYFETTPPEDAMWGLYFLMGKKIKSVITTTIMKAVALELAGISQWLFDECYHRVGDLSETISLLIGEDKPATQTKLTAVVEKFILPLQLLEKQYKADFLADIYKSFNIDEIFIFNKLIIGNFRIGVSSGLIIKSLASVAKLSESIIAQRLLGEWQPSEQFYDELLNPIFQENMLHKQPLMLAHPLTKDLASLGEIADWQVEWKLDGIRAQIVISEESTQLWSRGEELINTSFPDILEHTKNLPPCHLDGEILAFSQNKILPFNELQRRINRKTVSKALAQKVPCKFFAFDILHDGKHDCRAKPLFARRKILEGMLSNYDALGICQTVVKDSWTQYAELQKQARSHKAEGFMLKAKNSPYVMGRKTGLWWKYKVAPFSCDAVLVQAQRGHGRRAGLFSDYTFALWHESMLVPFAKAYSGLTDKELEEVNRFVRRNTLERFGPVAVVKPTRVFEIAFEAIQLSTRHKSGIAVRFPRILRLRDDKKARDADNLQLLFKLLKVYEA